ncbi:MAG: L,D-transpeptidase family protein [Bacteroidota bacterium]
MRFPTTLFSALSIALVLYSCTNQGDNKPKENLLFSKKIKSASKLKMCLEGELKNQLQLNDSVIQWLSDRYKKNNYKLLWFQGPDSNLTLSEKGSKIKDLVDRPLWYGIPENRIALQAKNEKHPIIADILMTAKSSIMLHDIQNGFFKDSIYTTPKCSQQSAYDNLLAKNDFKELPEYLFTCSSADSNYQFLARKIYEFCSLYPLDRTTFQVKSIKEDSVNWKKNAAQALHLKGYLSSIDTSNILFDKALKTFQIQNGLKPDGKVGTHTATALNESTYDKILRAALTLDKIRTKVQYPSKFVRINLPEYLLRYVIDDTLRSVHNVVIGKYSNQTPQLKSKIHTIVVYPYWTVPFSISSKEILPAQKANSGYIKRHNYKLFRGDTEIDPASVNWKKIPNKTFPYKIVQEPGPKNSLGIVKFEFHNKYSVYVHDSPQKNFFKSDVRSYSHGCMRCALPDSLARLMLNNDSTLNKRRGNHLIGDSLDSLLIVAKNYPIRLIDPVPVYVEYQSVVATEEDLIFYLDIYHRDEKFLKSMRDINK